MEETKQLLARFQGKEIKALKPEVQASVARYSPCGKILAAAMYNGTIRCWDATTEEFRERAAVTGHSGWSTDVVFQPHGELAFSCDSWGKLQSWIYLAEEFQPAWQHATAHDGWVRALAVSPDGKTVVSCGMDQFLRLWNAATGEKQGEWKTTHDPYCVSFAPDGESLFLGDERGITKQCQLDSKVLREFNASELYTLSRLQDVGGVRCLSISKDGKTLAVGGTIPKNGGTVTGPPLVVTFDIATGERKQKIELGDTADVNVVDLFLHEAGFYVVVTCGSPGKGQLLYWRPEDKEPFYREKKYANPQSVSLRPDGKQLAILATNTGSNGNGRTLRDGKYLGNHSPIHVLQLPDGI